MKIIEIIKFNRELLRNLHIVGVRLSDTNYIDLYTEYRQMLHISQTNELPYCTPYTKAEADNRRCTR